MNLEIKSNSNIENRLHGLDQLRALAIILVFFFHYQFPIFGHPEWLNRFDKFGWAGVDLFFVLSGFLISSQLFSQIKQGKQIAFKDFFLKRFFRILPAYWVVLAIYFYFPLFREHDGLPPLWKFLTFTQNFGLYTKDFGSFSQAWSLCVEEHFYFLLPIILFFLQFNNRLKRSYWILIILFILGFFLRYYCWKNFYLPRMNDENAAYYWNQYMYYPTYNRLDGLLIGVAIAGIYRFLPDVWIKITKRGNLFIMLGILLLLALDLVFQRDYSFTVSVFAFPLVNLAFGCLLIGAVSPSGFLYQLQSKIITLIAELSYSIYLIHKGVIHVTQTYFTSIDIDSHLMLVICILSSVFAAFMLHVIIEKPFMRLRKRLVA